MTQNHLRCTANSHVWTYSGMVGGLFPARISCQCGKYAMVVHNDGNGPLLWYPEPTICDEDVIGPPPDNPGFSKDKDFAEWSDDDQR